MFQTFDTESSPSQGAGRLAALRTILRAEGLAGFIVPRADAHQGEYVAPCDARLQWLTGFTGSAGFCVVLPDTAGVFIDGRYRTQVKGQVDLTRFTPVAWPDVQAGPWITEHLASAVLGYDPWLHTTDEIEAIEKAFAGHGLSLRPTRNLVDAIWTDRPDPPMGMVNIHPEDLAGETSQAKRKKLAEVLASAGQKAAILTQPDSICWLLNIRGADLPRNPVLQAFAILHDNGNVSLFAEPAKFEPAVMAHLGPDVDLAPMAAFLPGVHGLQGPVRLDRKAAPILLAQDLAERGTEVAWGDDPCRLPKAIKNAAEIAGARAAHQRDAAAMVEFLVWLDGALPRGGLSEIDVVTALEGFRRATNVLHDISFDTIAGAGPNGAIMHYRVTEETNRPVGNDTLLLVDSGGQYLDGTTDITRTIAVGDPGPQAREAFTRVLQGMIAISRVRWPKGLAGRDLDALARFPLWLSGQDFNHGTGHGVGAFLSVHEGPQGISRRNETPLEPGMILSNEPGYYREGEWGIRLENLIVVEPAPALPHGDAERQQLQFETLTFVPLDQRLILREMLSPGEKTWINAYHAEVWLRLETSVSAEARAWLEGACRPL